MEFSKRSRKSLSISYCVYQYQVWCKTELYIAELNLRKFLFRTISSVDKRLSSPFRPNVNGHVAEMWACRWSRLFRRRSKSFCTIVAYRELNMWMVLRQKEQRSFPMAFVSLTKKNPVEKVDVPFLFLSSALICWTSQRAFYS